MTQGPLKAKEECELDLQPSFSGEISVSDTGSSECAPRNGCQQRLDAGSEIDCADAVQGLPLQEINEHTLVSSLPFTRLDPASHQKFRTSASSGNPDLPDTTDAPENFSTFDDQSTGTRDSFKDIFGPLSLGISLHTLHTKLEKMGITDESSYTEIALIQDEDPSWGEDAVEANLDIFAFAAEVSQELRASGVFGKNPGVIKTSLIKDSDGSEGEESDFSDPFASKAGEDWL